jgi:NAD(P)-dependent dehydrogenase (short-subunit alcohol dehydrogenase family)
MATNGTHRSVVITGASTGIGEACALRLDRAGFRVFAGVRKTSDGDALRAKASPMLTPVRIDVTDAASIEIARDLIASEVGDAGVSGLVNNAGVAVAGGFEFVPLDDLRQQLEVNVIGQVAVTQAFLPMLRKQRGRIVFMGSIAGRVSSPFIGPYAVSKHAIEAITDALRQELRPWAMQVSVIEPGSIKTPIWDKADAQADQIERSLSAEARRLYGPAIAALRKFAAEAGARGIPADEVAKAVEHALTARTPKTRYLVGMDAHIQAALRVVVPNRILDGLVERQLKLKREAPPEPAAAAAEEREPVAHL